MSYSLVPLRVRDALAAGRWRYPGPYAIYNFSRAEILTTALLQRVLLSTVFYSVLDERREFVGLFTLTPSRSSVEVGVAMRPDLTGKGRGLAYLEAGLRYARERYCPRRFTLDVAAFNERARKVYERAGFHEVGRMRRRTSAGLLEHIEMAREE